MAIFAVIYQLFAEPFRDLHLALSFNSMKNQICQQEGLISESFEFDREFEARLGFVFNSYLLLSKRIPTCLKSMCVLTNKPNSISFDKMISHFDELVNQVRY